MRDSYYDVAQICMNGHEITSMYQSYPQHGEKFCKECGAKSMTNCQRCQASIKGHYHVSGVIGGYDYDVPSYCSDCGSPYPWTQLKFEAIEGLDDERKVLKDCLPDIARSTPKSELAAVKFKKIVIKSKDFGKSILQKVLTDLATDQTKAFLLALAKDWVA